MFILISDISAKKFLLFFFFYDDGLAKIVKELTEVSVANEQSMNYLEAL
jgi:hypothetical protein